MGLEEMIGRIEKEAQNEARIILNEAKKEASLIRDASGLNTKKEIFDLQKKLDKEMITSRNILISDGKRKARQALLSSKEDLIWETLSEVRKWFSKMDESELYTYLVPLYDKASTIIGQGMIVYPVRDLDAIVLKGKPGVQMSIETSTTLPSSVNRYKGKDLIGGIIATTSDGSKVVNMSFHGLIEKEEERIREIIARTLFGE